MRCVALRRRGFTLIELLVVIAIIAILAAILFPIFANAKERSRQVHCVANLKQLCQAMRRYSDDNSGRFPHVGWGGLPNWCGCGSASSGAAPISFAQGQLWPYVKNTGVFLCYTDVGRKGRYSYYENGTLTHYPLSYSMNTYLSAEKVDALPMRRPSRMFLLIHEQRGKAGGTGSGDPGINDGIYCPCPWSSNPQDLPDKVHYNGSTVGYIDCHARWMGYDEMLAECRPTKLTASGGKRTDPPSYWIPTCFSDAYAF